jgi:arylsulfatase A-like enzyme
MSVTLSMALPLFGVQVLVTNGAWIQQQWWRWPSLVVLFFVEMLLLFRALRFFAQLKSPPKPWGLIIAGVLASMLCAALDRFLFPGLYAPFHLGVTLAALGLASIVGVYAFQGSRPVFFWGVSPLFFCMFLPSALWLRETPAAWGVVSKSAGVAKTFAAAAVAAGIGPERLMGTLSEVPQLEWPEGTPRPNLQGADIVLITIDALRPDRLGAYGSHKNLSPNLDALAKKSVVFNRAYSPSPTSSYSLASLFCSRYALGQMPDKPASWPTLAQHLADNGYTTSATYNQGIFFTDRERFTAFAESGFGFQQKHVEYLDSYELSRRSLAFLREAQIPAFVWLHLAEPHEPYQVRPGFDRGPTPEDRYDAEVWYADKHLGQLLTPLQAWSQERGRNVIVIVASDHGEAFGEHGVYYHTSDVYAEQTHIPFFIYYPGITPRTIDAPQSLVDLAPTLLDLLGLPPLSGAQGRSLAPLLVGQTPDNAPIFSEWRQRRAITRGTDRLLCDTSTNACELFDIAADVAELRDLSGQKPALVAELAGQLNAFLARQDKHKDAVAWPTTLEQLARHDLTQVTPALDYVFDPNPKIRTRAVQLLGEVKAAEAKETLVTALQDESSEVQLAAALSLASLNDPRAVTTLQRLLPTQKDPERRAAMLVALASLRAVSSQELSEALASQNLELVRKTMALLVAQQEGSPLLIERLSKLLSIGPLTEETALALALLQAKDAIPALLKALQETTQIPARTALVKALGQLGDPISVEVLAERAAFGEGGDHVGEALLLIGGEPPALGVGGPAKKVLGKSRAWKCADHCVLQKAEGSLSLTLPKVLQDRPYTLLLYAQGEGTLTLSVAGNTLQTVALSKEFIDLRMLIPKELLTPNTTLTLRLRAPDGLRISLVMLLPVPDDISTRYNE